MENEMELLLSEQELVINGEQVKIHKFPMLAGIRLTSQLSKIVGKVLTVEDNAGIIDTAVKALATTGETDADTTSFRLYGIRVLLELLGDDLVDLIAQVISKSTDLPLKEVEKISLEDGIDLLFAIYEVNKNFFTKFSMKLQSLAEKNQAPKARKKKA